MSDCELVRCLESEYYLRDTKKPLQLMEHQRRILNAAFAMPGGVPRYTTVVYSCCKKSGKTEIGGALTYAFCRVYGGDAISVANDEEQAESRMFRRVESALKVMQVENPKLFAAVVHPDQKRGKNVQIVKNGLIEFCENHQVNPGPHTLRYIANDYAGEAGAMNALTVFDELWAVSSERGMRLWTELQPIPTLPVSLRLVTTYAGFYGESELLWALYDAVVAPDKQTEEPTGFRVEGLEDLPCYQLDRTFVYWDHEARMPWQTAEFLESARNDPSVKNRPSEHRRLWLNEWTTGIDAFLEMETVDRQMQSGAELGNRNHLAA